MKMLETTLSIGRTINLGNYESLRIDLSIRAELDSDEYSSELKSLESVLSRNIEDVISRQLNKPSGNISGEEFI